MFFPDHPEFWSEEFGDRSNLSDVKSNFVGLATSKSLIVLSHDQ